MERTNNIETTLTIVRLAVNHLEMQVNSQLTNLSTIQEAKHQQLNQTIRYLDTQIHVLRVLVSAQSSKITVEFHETLASVPFLLSPSICILFQQLCFSTFLLF